MINSSQFQSFLRFLLVFFYLRLFCLLLGIIKILSWIDIFVPQSGKVFQSIINKTDWVACGKKILQRQFIEMIAQKQHAFGLAQNFIRRTQANMQAVFT